MVKILCRYLTEKSMNCLNIIGKVSLTEIEVDPVVVDYVDY